MPASIGTAVTGVPSADILLDYLIGSREERLQHGQTECLSRFQVDDHLQFLRSFDWQVSPLFPFENPAGVNALDTICGGLARSITEQATGFREIAVKGNRRNGVAQR